MTSAILFPLGIRLTTWVMLLAFVALAAWRSEREPLIAAVAWLAGFEGAYQIASVLLHTPPGLPLFGSISISLIVGMPLIAVAMTILGARPDPILIVAALLAFVVWLATGFHVNTTLNIASIEGEALNDASKTLWALAYLVPLVRDRTSRDDLAAA